MANENDIEDFEPKSRNEMYLKACCLRCGCTDLPQPKTRTEELFYQLAELLHTENNT